MIKLSPPNAYGALTELDVVAQSLVMMTAFALCGMLARMRPGVAVAVALACLIVVTVHDLQRYADVFEAGIINKSVLAMVLLRATITATVGRLM